MPPTKVQLGRRAEFGARLQELRLRSGLTQELLAHEAGLHRTYVGGVERGERNVSLDAIWRLADALAVRPGVFFALGPESCDVQPSVDGAALTEAPPEPV
ncbi:helix-turn-helix domain-containing protein [Microlunatus antarcticus]|uniref:helix-turn-helix domain-containing protein n=1 Tax=Microlunatus antarcticus TaxID=53388 RepID=UPI002FCCD279